MSSLQEHLFQRIREKLPPGSSLAEVVAEHLHVSLDSAYRRIRGETPLVLEEAGLLCAAFGISLDHQLGAAEQALAFTAFEPAGDLAAYLRQWLHRLEQWQEAARPQLIYFCKDLPLFHELLIPELLEFRYYFWMRSILRDPSFSEQPFRPGSLPPEIRELASGITAAYAQIPSIEVWNAESVNSTLVQIDYYRQAGYFASEADARGVYRALARTLEHVRLQAEAGTKFLPGQPARFRKANFELYHNRLVLADNSLIAHTGDRLSAYLSYDVLHYLVTTDADFCAHRLRTLEDRIRRSTLISRVGEKQREMFFNHLIRKIPSTINPVQP